MKLIDTHCHLDFPVFSERLSELIARARHLGVSKLIVPGVTASNWAAVAQLSQQYPSIIYPAFGLHPCFLVDHLESHIDQLADVLTQMPDAIVGEIGLDFYIPQPNEALQSWYFEEQVRLASRFERPIIVHCRKAHDQCLKIIRTVGFAGGGVIHAYSGSLQQAQKYLDAGFKLGIGGAATYDRAKKLHRLLQALPSGSFVLETDSPDIPPSFARGVANTPENLPRIAEYVASYMGMSLDELSRVTTENALAAFHCLANPQTT